MDFGNGVDDVDRIYKAALSFLLSPAGARQSLIYLLRYGRIVGSSFVAYVIRMILLYCSCY